MPVNTFLGVLTFKTPKNLAVFSHWYESTSHCEKAEAHKGKVIFYLYLERAKTICQNKTFISKFSLGLV